MMGTSATAQFSASIPIMNEPFSPRGQINYLRRRARWFLGRARRIWMSPYRRGDVSPPLDGYYRDGSGPPRGQALVSLLVEPLRATPTLPRFPHANAFQALGIARALNRLGFVVDAIDWKDLRFKPQKHYDVLIGFHDRFEELVQSVGSNTRRIYFATMAHEAFVSQSIEAHWKALRSRRGFVIPPMRLPSTQVRDRMIEAAISSATTWRPSFACATG